VGSESLVVRVLLAHLATLTQVSLDIRTASISNQH
jgi:hypothetical protein